MSARTVGIATNWPLAPDYAHGLSEYAHRYRHVWLKVTVPSFLQCAFRTGPGVTVTPTCPPVDDRADLTHPPLVLMSATTTTRPDPTVQFERLPHTAPQMFPYADPRPS